MPKKTPLGLNSGINLQNSLNIEDQDQTIRPFEQPAPAILNNGIWHDGGITELYEQSSTKTGYDAVYAASNGKLLKLKWVATAAAEIYVESNGVTDYIAEIPAVFFRKRLLEAQYLDVALCSDGTHVLAARANMTGLYIDELLISDFSVVSTVTIGTGALYRDYNLLGVAICRAHDLTAASVFATSGVVVAYTGGNTYYYLNGADYVINSAVTLTSKKQAGYITAFYHAGTVVATCPGVTPIVRSGVSPYAPANWTTQTLSAINGIMVAQETPLVSGTATMALLVSTASKTIPVWKLTISAVGAVATVTQTAIKYPDTAVETSFELLDGIVLPYGTSGTCKTTGAALYGVSLNETHRDNVPPATIPLQKPELFTQVYELGLTAGIAVVYINSYNGIPAILTAGGGSTISNSCGAMLNDFGGGGFDSDMTSGHTWNNTSTGGLLWPFDCRDVAAQTPEFIYKRNDGKFVFCEFFYQTGMQYTEIAPGVVSINAVCSFNTIIDLNTGKAYENMSGYTCSFLGNYTSIAASRCYLKKSNKYSSSFDPGLLRIDPLATSINGGYYAGRLEGFNIWDGTTGAYVSSIYETVALDGVAFRDPQFYGSTYVFTGTVPPAGDSVFEGGGIKMLSSSAIQYPGYFGYLLVNQFQVSYQAFFILQGNFYAYDGNYVYLIQLTSGNFGTVVGRPQIMATAAGLTYLCSGPEMAYFLNNYDNGVWTYNGGRTLEKLGHFDQFGAIMDGTFNVHDNVLLLKTEAWLVSLREGVVTANPNPHVVPYSIHSTFNGAYFVKTNVVKLWSHLPLTVPTASVIMPLDYQSSYFGLGGMHRYKMIKVVGTVFCEDKKASPFTITWNWLTQDEQGTQTQTFNTSLRNTDGYMHFEMQPYPDGVLGGSIGIKKEVHWHFTGDTVITTKTIKNISPATTGLDILVGGAITDSGGLFAAGTVVSSIDSATQITVSNNASATATADTFTAAATAQRIVLMDLSVYYTEESEANLVTKSV
jgi:hypothetical protein